MATYTSKLNLKKPDATDFYNIKDFNENMEKIDEHKHTTDYVNSIGMLTPGIVNDPTYPLNYQGDLPDGYAKDVGLPANMWWHISYQRHSVNASGFGLLIAYPLNNSKEKPRYRTSEAGKVWNEWKGLNDDGNAGALGGLLPTGFVQNIGNVPLNTLKDSTYQTNYQTNISNETALELGLNANWWHLTYQKHATTGYGLQIVYPLNNANEMPRYRTSVGIAWDKWKVVGDGGNSDTVDGKHATDFAMVGHTHSYLKQVDTRNDNSSPQWYMTNYSNSNIVELKTCSKIGITSGYTYCQVETHVPWIDSSGGFPFQIATNTEGTWFRGGTSNDTWGIWVIETRMTAGTTDITAGTTTLGKNKLYVVYE
ncbi:hypothetical protein [Lachnoclostridium phytofermentans]|uniref:Uncharacterized protein n=1 Tax=Lachnoclostridium phytofermentans (strain ATCC 700394 / DSM 18823 / ISDg) TaxID=357809 RepID=A9KKL1_LACP7|nr:hypothetical protein [Lachnoclostridium phytofermentans]ABX41182.1 hypothetical protein Cphy_0795 [Lachnoclostridium phytofermentans ISDg]